jgi:hypothetical protein
MTMHVVIIGDFIFFGEISQPGHKKKASATSSKDLLAEKMSHCSHIIMGANMAHCHHIMGRKN